MQALPDTSPLPPGMALALAASFGSLEHWHAQLVAAARDGGTGALQLAFQDDSGMLVNERASVSGTPLLTLDESGHDPLEAAAAVETLLATIDWAAVYSRYQLAVTAASDRLQASAQEAQQAAHLIDVRRAGAYAGATTTLPGARWRDPAAIGTWLQEIPVGAQVVVYCVHGHDVSRAAALRLRAAGIKARFLQGGLEGWAASGHALQPKDAV